MQAHVLIRGFKGFSLIEVLVVLAVVGVLAAIVVPVYNGYMKSSRQEVANANLQTLRLAEEAYFFEHNSYVAGTDNAGGGIDQLRTPLGWSPNKDGNQFVYTVAPCPAGTIQTCFAITVTGFNGAVTASYPP